LRPLGRASRKLRPAKAQRISWSYARLVDAMLGVLIGIGVLVDFFLWFYGTFFNR
jgi:hypothetical protein